MLPSKRGESWNGILIAEMLMHYKKNSSNTDAIQVQEQLFAKESQNFGCFSFRLRRSSAMAKIWDFNNDAEKPKLKRFSLFFLTYLKHNKHFYPMINLTYYPLPWLSF